MAKDATAPEPDSDHGPDWGDEAWQEDRPVFDREEQIDKNTGRPVKVLVVPLEARKHWSDKNPKKFSPETALKIIQYVGGGSFLEQAALAGGICRMTLQNWIKAAENPDHPRSTEELRAWKRALDEAEAFAEARAVAGILQAGMIQWQAFAWYLERKHWNRWGKKDTSMLANPDGSPLTPQQVAFTIVDPKKKDEPEEQPAT